MHIPAEQAPTPSPARSRRRSSSPGVAGRAGRGPRPGPTAVRSSCSRSPAAAATRSPRPPPPTRRSSPECRTRRRPRTVASPRQGVRSFPGSTPGLYGGTRAVGSCDVGKQIGFLSSDPGKARSFAQAAGVPRAAVPDFLRGLTSVVLRADTQVTDHGFRDGRATSFQSVLQRGTAVLVDDRGVPRVRCAGGNPLNPPPSCPGRPRGSRGSPGPVSVLATLSS